MIINANFTNNILKYEFILESKYNDQNEFVNNKNQIIKLVNNHCKFIIPPYITKINADIIALIALIIIFPFLGDKVTINTGISNNFHKVFIKSGKQIEPIIDQKYNYSNNNLSSISFKSSTNCLSSLLLLPKNTYIINLFSLSSNVYYEEYNYFILDRLLSFKYKVYYIKSDFKNLIYPSGFSHFLSCSIGNIILSQYLGLNSITFGYSLKNINYLNKEIDYLNFDNFNFCLKNENYYNTFNFWDEIFKIFNLKLNFNLVGITEIMNHYLVYNSKFKNMIKSNLLIDENQKSIPSISLLKHNLLYHIIQNKNINFEYLDFYYQSFLKSINQAFDNNDQYLYDLSLICLFHFINLKYKDLKQHILFQNLGIKDTEVQKNKDYFFKINSSSFKYMDSKLLDFFLNKIQTNITNII